MSPSAPPRHRGFFGRAWVPETLTFFAVLWQESIRLELRTAHRVLPITPGLTQWYYFQFGDFVNGYINAFIVDGLTEFIRRRRASGVLPPDRARVQQVLIASLLSIISILVVEIGPSSLNRADLADIPAGVAGSLLYLGVRVAALRWQHGAPASPTNAGGT
ncbi:MAG: hypothetical protein KA154_11330 [Gemmatimonadaceae bacterium]|jgi:hypothetical protein|nr:hypothetical protein [Gemmatimonadaceae bacterium]